MIFRKSCGSTLFFILLALLSYYQSAAQESEFRNQVVIQSSRKYSGSAIDRIIYIDDPKGFSVKTKDGRGHFLNWEEAENDLGIILRKEGFLLPKDASAVYYDQSGIPSDTYKKNDYTKVNSDMFPLPVKAFQLRYGTKSSPQPLWLIDDREVSKEEAMALHPETIKSVDILSSDSALQRYGEKAKDGAVIIALQKIRTKDTVSHVEIMCSFPGGMQAWRYFIDSSIRYPPAALKAGIKGKVKLSLIIEKDGSVSATPLTQLGYGIEEEAIRVVTTSPKWTPATQDGRPVTIRFIQSLTFDVM